MASGCRVYAIVGRATPLPAPGARGAGALALVPWRELAAVAGPAAAEHACLTIAAARQHEAVVEAVRRLGPALPVRFGTIFADAPAVAAALAARYEALAADLERLGDKVELGLTALWNATSANAPRPTRDEGGASAARSAGARYLLGRAAELRRRDELEERARAVARELDQRLGGLTLERRVSILPVPQVALRAAYLLEPARVDACRAAFESMRQARSEPRLLLTGPWPPYSFVSRTDTADGGARGDAVAELAQRLVGAMAGRPG